MVASSFDVSERTKAYSRFQRGGRLLGALAFLVFLLFGVLLPIKVDSLLTSGASLTDPWVVADVVGAAISLVLLGMAVWFVIAVGPGAARLEVGSDGLRMVYESGRTRLLAWSDPRNRILVRDWRNIPSIVKLGWPLQLVIPWSGPTVLSDQAFDKIISDAQTYGAQVRNYPGSSKWYGFPITIHEIRGGSRVHPTRTPHLR